MASKIFFCYTIKMLPITIRKRTIASADLEFIQNIIYQNWAKGRTQISKILCRKWNWTQPNDCLKGMACRKILLTLYRKNLINYPPGVHDGNNKKRNCDQLPMISFIYPSPGHLPVSTGVLLPRNVHTLHFPQSTGERCRHHHQPTITTSAIQ